MTRLKAATILKLMAPFLCIDNLFIPEEPKNTLLFDPQCPHLKEFTILSILPMRYERVRKIFIT